MAMFGRKKEEMKTPTVYCRKCGLPCYDNESRFCTRCGNVLFGTIESVNEAESTPIQAPEAEPTLIQAPEAEPVKVEKKQENTYEIIVDVAEVMRKSKDKAPEKPLKPYEEDNKLTSDMKVIKQLLEGFTTGHIEEAEFSEAARMFRGWDSLHDGTVAIGLPCAYKEFLSFRMMINERKVNKLDHGGPNRGVIIHHNIQTIDFDADAREISFYDGVEGAFPEDAKNVFTFYLNTIKVPKAPGEPKSDIDLRMKQLTDGFRRGKLEGWDINGDEASIVLPCYGGYVDFKMKSSTRSINRLRCNRSDCRYIINNIVTISKGGNSLHFDDGVADERISPNHTNFVYVIMKKTMAE